MKTLFLDIETLPADSKNPITGKALKYLFEKKLEKKAKRRELSENVLFEVEQPQKSQDLQFEDYVRGTSFDGSFGRILCICLAMDDGPVEVIYFEEEKEIIEKFWKIASTADLFVGHNILDFDLKFIWQRSVILGIKPTWELDRDSKEVKNGTKKYLYFGRYSSKPIFDTMHEWGKWKETVGLEHIGLALGIPTPKEGIDGSKVWDFYKAGRIKDITDYCSRDVETTRAVYKRMTFQM